MIAGTIYHVLYLGRKALVEREIVVLRHSKLFEGLKVQLGEDPIQARRGGLRAGGEAPVINAEPISVVHPSDVVENIVDSHNISADKGELSLIDPDAPSYLEEGKSSMVAGKRKVVLVPMERVSIERLKKFMLKQYLSVVSSFLLKILIKYLRGISIEQLCDIHDKAYMRQAVLDNVLNGVGVNGLHSEYSKLILEKKKWINYEQTLSTLRAKVEGLGSKGKILEASKI
ncbi:hypothetical protein Tco_0077830 [Tanacetum coccineum]